MSPLAGGQKKRLMTFFLCFCLPKHVNYLGFWKALEILSQIAYNMDNRTRHASQRCVPRRVIFVWGWMKMSKKQQRPLTVPEQIENLKQLNLQVSDEEFAKW